MMSMWNWIKRRELIARNISDAPSAERDMGTAPGRVKVHSKYAPLHEYLANRFADSVVLTFGQLEDLLGSALPDSARVQHEWWTSTDRDSASHRVQTPGSWPAGLPRRTSWPGRSPLNAEPSLFEAHGPSSDYHLGRDCRCGTCVLYPLVKVSTGKRPRSRCCQPSVARRTASAIGFRVPAVSPAGAGALVWHIQRTFGAYCRLTLS